jgi:ribosomal protein S30
MNGMDRINTARRSRNQREFEFRAKNAKSAKAAK